jgi:cytochrome c biogenesis protein CcmG/thiol:disulfide interchange protein DsbE
VKKLSFLSSALVLILCSFAFGQFQTGQQAPDFTLPDLDGNYVTLSELVGDGPIYINFWATWCGPCKREIPEVIELYHEYKDRGFKVLAISTDGSRTAGKVRSFVKDRGMDFTVLLDSNQEVFSRKYKGRGIPYGFLIDNDGKILHSVTGYLPGIGKILTEKMTPYLKPVAEKKTEGDQTKEKTEQEKTQDTEK